MNELQLRHCATYDRYGVRTTQPELLTCGLADAETREIRIAIGADPLTRKTYTLSTGEAARLADWILSGLIYEPSQETDTMGTSRGTSEAADAPQPTSPPNRPRPRQAEKTGENMR